MGEKNMKDDPYFLRLLDLYSPLLTETQREIARLYFDYDLSLGEIAEQKGVSRQSVSDCLQKCRKQLQAYETKLGFAKELEGVVAAFTAYKTRVENRLNRAKDETPSRRAEIEAFEKELSALLPQTAGEE